MKANGPRGVGVGVLSEMGGEGPTAGRLGGQGAGQRVNSVSTTNLIMEKAKKFSIYQP